MNNEGKNLLQINLVNQDEKQDEKLLWVMLLVISEMKYFLRETEHSQLPKKITRVESHKSKFYLWIILLYKKQN